MGTTTLASFVYDGSGKRQQKTAGGVPHTYLYDEKNIIEERLSSGQTNDYVQGPGTDRPLAQRDQASVVSYYLGDHLGSIAQITSNTGAVTLTREYDPWGNMLQGASVGGYAFTGREWDPETSTYYYRARHYDQAIGRLLSEDPIRFKGGNNFYTYVANNPIAFTDPTGLLRDCDAEHIECFETCYNGPRIYPCQKRKDGCMYRLCQAKCLAEYMEAIDRNVDYLRQILRSENWRLLRRNPPIFAASADPRSTMRGLMLGYIKRVWASKHDVR